MQKVEGSSPSALSETPQIEGFFFFRIVSTDGYAASYNNSVQQTALRRVCRLGDVPLAAEVGKDAELAIAIVAYAQRRRPGADDR